MLSILWSLLLVMIGTALVLVPLSPLLIKLGLGDSLIDILAGKSAKNAGFLSAGIAIIQTSIFFLVVKWRYIKQSSFKNFLGIEILPPTAVLRAGFKYWILLEFLRILYDFCVVKMGWSPSGPGGQTWMTGLGGWELTALLVGPAIIGPFGEEIFFRGYAFRKFLEKWSFASAAIASSLLFAVLHGINIQTPILFVHGFFFALVLKKTNTLLVPFIAHWLLNSTTVLLHVFNVVFYRP